MTLIPTEKCVPGWQLIYMMMNVKPDYLVSVPAVWVVKNRQKVGYWTIIAWWLYSTAGQIPYQLVRVLFSHKILILLASFVHIMILWLSLLPLSKDSLAGFSVCNEAMSLWMWMQVINLGNQQMATSTGTWGSGNYIHPCQIMVGHSTDGPSEGRGERDWEKLSMGDERKLVQRTLLQFWRCWDQHWGQCATTCIALSMPFVLLGGNSDHPSQMWDSCSSPSLSPILSRNLIIMPKKAWCYKPWTCLLSGFRHTWGVKGLFYLLELVTPS